MPRKKTQEEFVNQVKIQNPNVNIIGTYVNYSTKIKVKFTNCGHIVDASPQGLLHGCGCSVCANNTRKSQEEFENDLRSINPNVEVIGQYINAHTPVLIQCRICGNRWEAKPSRLQRNFQCMNCIRPHTSFMEQFILLSFIEALGRDKVLSRDQSAIGKEIDIYIPDYQYAVEPGSWLYHKNKNKSDSLKRELCARKGIRLITIYDTFPKGKNKPFSNDCYVFDGFLNENGYERLITLVSDLLHEIGYDDISKMNWQEISNKAYLNCHRDADKEFSAKLKQIMPEIELLEQYKGVNTLILVNKKTCNHPAWKARPYMLLKGVGCPICGRENAAKTRTRTHDEFVRDMQKINPSISVIGDYTRVTNRILVECKNCRKQWEPLCYSLLQGKGCPHCSAKLGAKKSKGRTKTKDTELFKQEMLVINPNINIIGEYINNKTKIQVSCRTCGFHWDVVPQSIYNGHGCPKCARRSK